MAVVGSAVAFDPGEVTSGFVWVNDAEVDPEPLNPDLRVKGPATSLQGFLDGIFQR